jgi:uncharacterized protein
VRIVLDTNVFISGIFFSGPPSQIIEAIGNQGLQVVLSKEILDEYHRVAESLSSKFPAVDIKPIIEFIIIHGQLIDTEDVRLSVCEDPDDDKFLECAVAGQCDIIISGDKHLLRVSGYNDITVLSPRNFVEKHL